MRHREGRRLFDVETFGGNGRTCRTCHSKKNGTFSPEDARERLVVTNQDGRVVIIDTPDPGVLLTFPLPVPPPPIPAPPRSFFANLFKIPTLWGVARTAPYFHDNSAKTLEDVAEHYAFYFRFGTLGFDFTPQDQADMVAFLSCSADRLFIHHGNAGFPQLAASRGPFSPNLRHRNLPLQGEISAGEPISSGQIDRGPSRP